MCGNHIDISHTEMHTHPCTVRLNRPCKRKTSLISVLKQCIVVLQNFLSLIPLALTLGDVTEDLALRFGDIVGGLLNATFGNIVEVIVSIAALEKGLYTVVATSLIGSVLSNLLLVLGGFITCLCMC